MSEINQLSRPIRIAVFEGTALVFEKTFTQGPIGFGRSSSMNVPLDYAFISRAHCKIIEENGKFVLLDLQSSNGISVAGTRVPQCEISENIEVQIGTLNIKIELLEAPKNIDNDATVAVNKIPQSIPAPIPVASKKSSTGSHSSSKKMKRDSVSKKIKGIKLKKSSSLLSEDMRFQFLEFHPGLGQAKSKKIEAIVTWHDQIYEIREFAATEVITVGPSHRAKVPVPTLTDNWTLARSDRERADCYVPPGRQVSLMRDKEKIEMGDLLKSRSLSQSDFGYTLKMNSQEVACVNLGSNIQVFLRYVPASRPLTNRNMVEPDQALKESFIGSAILHGLLALIMLFNAPAQEGPKLKNVPERFARLLIEKPKPKPTPLPPPPEVKKIVQKPPERPEPKKVVQKKKIPFKLPKVLAKVNKFPMEVKNPIPKAPPPVKVENLGALAALGAISKNPSTVPTNININKDAGGLPTKNINTGGIVGALPSSNGNLAAAGGGHVKTKGMGYGSGTGYGIQGLKGAAGGRAVAGAIVGQPKLASTAKTEGLTRAQVMAIVQKYLGEIQHCYERNLLANPGLVGRMEFEWDITALGSVSSVRVKRSTVNGGDNLGECVKGIFAGMRFPAARNGQTTTPNIGFPFGRL